MRHGIRRNIRRAVRSASGPGFSYGIPACCHTGVMRRSSSPPNKETHVDKPTGPLAGIKVIDITTVVLGPYASQVLGDMGADVIKVETTAGDTTRYIGPSRTKGMGSYFAALNRNKRSVAMDLKKPAAMAALLRLIDAADVF